MRKLLLFLLLFAAYCCKAKTSAFSNLSEVNAEWKNNADGQLIASSVNINSGKSYHDWIAIHLMFVEQTLRLRPVQQLSAAQKENRYRLLDELNVYWQAGTFPVNDFLSYKSPVFIDRIGTHCAVGYLMQQSGAEQLARKIDADNKFVYVKSIKTKGVSEWAFENGFTIDELAWIQPSYLTAFTVDDMEGGLNGCVKTMITDPANQLLYAGGSFNASTKGAMCNGVAVYISGIAGWDWVGLGSGVNGTVNTMLIHNDKLYVGGEFSTAGAVPASNAAVFDLNSQQWQPLGSLDSAVNTLAVYNNEIYAGGKFTGLVSKWSGSQWQDITSGFIYGGEARTLEVWNNNLLIGGSFELATGAIRRNAAVYDGVQMNASGFGTITPVNDFEIYHDTIYAACDVVAGTDTCALARFVNSDWEVILKPVNLMSSSFDGTSILQLMIADDRLFGAGEFFCSWGMIYGNRMMEIIFDHAARETMCVPFLFVDSTIHTMVNSNNVITFGGDFITSVSDTLNHAGQLFNIINEVSSLKRSTSNSIVVFPNPAADRINIQLKEFAAQKSCLVKIHDMMGQEVFVQKINQPLVSFDFAGTSAGIYLVQVVDEDGITLGTKRVVLR